MAPKRKRTRSNKQYKDRKPASTISFFGNKEAVAFRDENLRRIMEKIDQQYDEHGFLPRGTIMNIYKQEKIVLPWLSINQIYGLRRRRAERMNGLDKSELESGSESESELEESSPEVHEKENKKEDDEKEDDESADLNNLASQSITQPSTSVLAIGRKKGSTNEAKDALKSKMIRMIDDITLTWDDMLKDYEDDTQLFELILYRRHQYKHGDDEEPVKEPTIISRCRRGNLVGVSRGNRSPMEFVEPTLCCILKFASRMGQYVTQLECLNIANELIKGKMIGRYIGIWKLKYHPQTRNRLKWDPSYTPSETVGWGWFARFRKRYQEITSKYVCNVKHYRSTWSTHAMLLDMYKLVYALFFQWGLTAKLSKPQWQDQDGNEVTEDKALGCKVEYELLYPDRILTMDETGDNGNQSDDTSSRVRGSKAICEDGVIPTKGSSTDDTQWTTQAFTTLGGKAVLFVIICKKMSVLDYNEYYGYDLSAEWIGDGEYTCKQGDLPTKEQINRNSGKGKRFPGPLSCEFNGVTIPTLMFASKGGGVNEDILVAALKHLDNLKVFPRDEGLPHPTLLVDGHGSRLQPKFVRYINNLKNNWTVDEQANHRWNVALGLPNSTHHWQVADSSELNQTFKKYSREYKEKIRTFQNLINATPSIKRHHVVSICNYAFARSFKHEHKVKKAVAMRGWNPLNMNCLMDEAIERTRVLDEATFNRGTPPSPAELNALLQGPQVISQFNWKGCVVQQVFANCNKQFHRIKVQDEEIRKRRKEQVENGVTMLKVIGKISSGKLYTNGIASVNDPNFIDYLRQKKQKVDMDVLRRQCKRYINLKKTFDAGEEALMETGAHGNKITRTKRNILLRA